MTPIHRLLFSLLCQFSLFSQIIFILFIIRTIIQYSQIKLLQYIFLQTGYVWVHRTHSPPDLLIDIGEEMPDWLVSLTETLMIVSLRPIVGQGLSNLSSSGRSTSPRSKPITQEQCAVIVVPSLKSGIMVIVKRYRVGLSSYRAAI